MKARAAHSLHRRAHQIQSLAGIRKSGVQDGSRSQSRRFLRFGFGGGSGARDTDEAARMGCFAMGSFIDVPFHEVFSHRWRQRGGLAILKPRGELQKHLATREGLSRRDDDATTAEQRSSHLPEGLQCFRLPTRRALHQDAFILSPRSHPTARAVHLVDQTTGKRGVAKPPSHLHEGQMETLQRGPVSTASGSGSIGYN